MNASLPGFHSDERKRKYAETEDNQSVVTHIDGESTQINDRRSRLITVCLPMHIQIKSEAKDRVERLYNNVIIIFNNERPSISNGDTRMLLDIAHMVTVGIH